MPGFRSGYVDAIKEAADGQPGWFTFWIYLQESRATSFVYLVSVAENLIALALIRGFARKLTYGAAIGFSLLIWSTAEGFGGPYTSGSADVGTAVIDAMVFASLLAFACYHGSPCYSVDHYLERRIGWWHRIAEVGHHDIPAVDTTSKPTIARMPAKPRMAI